ncbi:hypothetical protein ACFQ3B_01125 [Stackebrandtia endophytica]|uniref:hypothetical protein n=1 Tax=Stackebrandtia endophytica TaxID=1496996 RepID=UPI00114EB4F6|nr:hypothetical protein [Stackebrandtia endophytica]
MVPGLLTGGVAECVDSGVVIGLGGIENRGEGDPCLAGHVGEIVTGDDSVDGVDDGGGVQLRCRHCSHPVLLLVPVST